MFGAGDEYQSKIKDLENKLETSEKELKDLIHKFTECSKANEVLTQNYNKLGTGTSFLDVEKLSEELTKHEVAEFQYEENIRAKRDELNAKRADVDWQVKQLIFKHKINKEERKLNGFSNDKEWEPFIKNELLVDEISDIEQQTVPLEIELMDLEHDRQMTKLHIKTLRRKLQNRLIFANALLNGHELDEQIIVARTEVAAGK